MKITKTASGKSKIKMSKKEWQSIGKKAGWMKTAGFGVILRLGLVQEWLEKVIKDPGMMQNVPEDVKKDPFFTMGLEEARKE